MCCSWPWSSSSRLDRHGDRETEGDCGFDGSEPAQRALEHAADLAGRGGSVTVIHVIASRSLSSRLVTVSEREQATQDRLLREAERTLVRRGVEPNVVAVGDPATEILAAAEAIGAGVIVIGRRSRRHLRTSLSSTLVRRAGTDVLVVH